MTPRALTSEFDRLFGRQDGRLFFAPGRVNLIGEHVDYTGGHVMPTALNMGTWCVAARRRDGMVRLASLNTPDGLSEVSMSHWDAVLGSWRAYPCGVLAVLSRAGYDLTGGLDLLFWGDLPAGAGLSSSASIETVTIAACEGLFGLVMTGVERALFAQRAEHEYAGVHCGIMDQFASSMGRRGHAVLLDCATLEYRHCPLELGDVCLVITDSGVRHRLNESRYNDRRTECEEALTRLRTRRNLAALCELTPSEYEGLTADWARDDIWRRGRHCVSENARTLDAARALDRSDLEMFGELMNQSHRSLRDDFQVTCPELDWLAECSWAIPGVLGSRMTGAGFGGCTVTLVTGSVLPDFRRQLADGYEAAFGRAVRFYPVEPWRGAGEVEAWS